MSLLRGTRVTRAQAGRYGAPVLPAADERAGVPRLVRAALFGSVALVVSAAAHVIGGGAVPHLLLFAALALPLALCCDRLSRKRRGPWAYAAALGAAQVVLHQTFMVAAPMCGPAMQEHASHTLHGHASSVAPLCATTSVHSTWMTACHVVATLLLALLLAHGEHLVSFVLEALALLLSGGPEAPTALPVRAVRLAHAVLDAALSYEPGLQVSRRGPPAALVHA